MSDENDRSLLWVNPAPDASPPRVPSPGKTTTISAWDRPPQAVAPTGEIAGLRSAIRDEVRRFEFGSAIAEHLADAILKLPSLIRLTGSEAAATDLRRKLEEARKALDNLSTRAQNFWAFVQGEYGVRLSSEDQEDHNVAEFFFALDDADKLVCSARAITSGGGNG